MPTRAPERWDEAYVSYVLEPLYERWQRWYWADFFRLQRAHLVALARAGWVERTQAARLAAALERVACGPLRGQGRPEGAEDLFFAAEQALRDEAGEAADNLHLGRSRNDIDATLYRMDARRALLSLHARLGELASALLALARRHVDTVMPAYTHGQPAQPTTLAHYLAAVAANVRRSRARLQAHYPTVNLCPLGAAALATSGFTVDRALLASLLGFEGVARNSYGAVADTDYALPFIAEIATAGMALSRFVADLFFWASREVAAIRIPDGFVQGSSIMPHKRNPVVLEHVRARLARLPGLVQQAYSLHTGVPYGDINDTADHLQGVWHEAATLLDESADLLTRALGGLQVDGALLLRRARESLSTTTELADTLVRRHGLSFRQAHRVVARLAAIALARGIPPERWTSDLLNEAATAEGLHAIATTDEEVHVALDPRHFVEIRRTLGGPSPSEVGSMLDEEEQALQAAELWRRSRLEDLEVADTRLSKAVADLASDLRDR